MDKPKTARKLAGAAKFAFERSYCKAPWKTMSGGDRLRWCGDCQHFVYNPAAMSKDELASLILFREGFSPRTLFIREDGLVVAVKCRASSAQQVGKIVLPVAGLSLLALLSIGCLSMAQTGAPTVQPPAMHANDRQALPQPAKSAYITNSKAQMEPWKYSNRQLGETRFPPPYLPRTVEPKASTLEPNSAQQADALVLPSNPPTQQQVVPQPSNQLSSASQQNLQPIQPQAASLSTQPLTIASAQPPAVNLVHRAADTTSSEPTTKAAEASPLETPHYVWDARLASQQAR
jgi:hypothetical protein